MEHFGIIFLIAGPSGVGKTTVCNRLLTTFRDQLVRVITTTSRELRPGEVNGRDYYFVTQEKFLEQIQAGFFYEYANVHGQWKGVYRTEILEKLDQGLDVLLSVDVQGAETFRELAQITPRLKDRITSVFLTPTSIEELKNRILQRGEVDDTELAHRLDSARLELAQAEHFDHVVTSSTYEGDFEAVKNIYLRAHHNT
jgi:guanylate kinase